MPEDRTPSGTPETVKPRKKGRGGKRPGAGRKKNTPNKATAERQKAVAESGPTPHEIQITAMRYFGNQFARGRRAIVEAAAAGKKPTVDGFPVTPAMVEDYIREAHKCATDAAPYVHPRLSAIGIKDFTAIEEAKRAADEGRTIDSDDYVDLTNYSEQQLVDLYQQEIRKVPGG